MLTSPSPCLSLLHRALPPIGQRWFEYNDTSVQPIDSKEIDKMFQGKKSAYMLFYRRKTLDRPAGGGTRGNVLNSIWPGLLDPLARCCSNGRCINCEIGSSVDHAIPIESMSIVCCHVNRRVLSCQPSCVISFCLSLPTLCCLCCSYGQPLPRGLTSASGSCRKGECQAGGREVRGRGWLGV